ncbi:MAG TPA: dethiobiotin synthase [Steroidobacteraceae bacterium]|nr:dethiobiotin synthase [Steroidobacteraceae bacterium]
MTSEPAKQGFFITGTDTGVGKTLVAVALTRAFVARGLRTAVMKPVAAGIVQTAQGPRNDDALELLAESNVNAPYEDVNPWLLTTPASPHLAARHDGVAIGTDRILAAQRRLAARADLVLVEGAGGWLAPISSMATMADVAAKLELPVIFIVGLRLGCLNHALLTREAIRSCGLPFSGWIANKMASEMPLAQDNIETLTSRFGMAPLTIVPPGTAPAPGVVPQWADEAAKKLVSA